MKGGEEVRARNAVSGESVLIWNALYAELIGSPISAYM